ncbi:aldo/keto reductase [Sphingomonas sp. KR3-1]|uniref:aldo/keto reductase n=1 Tax=Sphingomonas sp. KR3-1 TaxID=3156611 RepID=UPI0032B45495
MTLRDLGTSGIQTPPLILGGNVFGWTADKATSFAVLDAFAAAGGTLIDTADVYSAWVPGHQGGESEAIIGEWLQQSGKRGQVKIATKVGMLDGEGGTKLAPARIAAACDASLKRLGVETIDLYFAHQDDEDVPQEDVLAAFDALIKAGKVQAIGASNFHALRLKSALDIATREGLPHFRALQNEYHLLSRHKYEGELQDLCVEYNIGCVPFYGLASGYLTGKYRSEADLGKSVRGGRMTAFMEGKGPAMLVAMDQVAEETGATLAQIALAWLAAQPGVTAPIASATSVVQVEELVGSWNVALSPAQLETLTNAGA